MKPPVTDKRLLHQAIPYQLRKGDLRKLEIIEAAIECLATVGFHHFTYEAVAKQSGIGKSHVAYHFKNLDALLEATIKYVYACGQGVVAEYLGLEKNPKHWLDSYIRGTFQWVKGYPKHGTVILLLGYLSLIDKKYHKLQEEVRNVGVGRVAAILEGNGMQSAQAAKVAQDVHAIIVGKVLQYLSTKRKEGVIQSAVDLIQKIQ